MKSCLTYGQQHTGGMAEGGEAVGSWGGPRCRGSAGAGAEPGVLGPGPARHGGGTRALCEPPAPPTGASGAAPPLASRPPRRPQLRFPEQSLPFPASERQAASPRVSQALADRGPL